MKFTLSWLKKHLDTDATLDQVVETMVKVGLEVEDVDNPAARLGAITVGHVVEAEKHPDADKLKVCKVQTSAGDMQIVCGAPNARAGINVAFAPVGTYIPGIDVTLSKAKIRGVESFGMMCSARELELGEDHDGIMELAPDAEVGASVVELLDLDDPVIDFEVTPNRPDTNGVIGVARDLAAAGLGTLIFDEEFDVAGTYPCPVNIEIDDETACPAFAGRVIRGVTNGPSPQWMQDQLRAIGLRPINMLVDVTNYLSYDRARPLHVYDLSKLNGSIRARMGREGEEFLALDGKTYTVDPSMCVIADDENVLGLGGVMGGEESGCTDETTDVFIESALFDALLIARTGRKTGIVSDARYRFERGVDPASVQSGLERATCMILEVCGGEPSEAILAGSVPASTQDVAFKPTDVERLTGMDIPDGDKEDILTDLGFGVQRGGTWTVRVPSFRPDIGGSADLVEEIARVHGLDNLPSTPLPPPAYGQRPTKDLMANRIKTARGIAANAGYHEAITWAFCDSADAERFGGNAALKLANPISSDLGSMRPSPLPNLLAAIGRNKARGAEYARVFEIGGAYRDDTPTGQDTVLTVVAYGARPDGWDGPGEDIGVFTAKALASAVLEGLGVNVLNLMTLAQGPDHLHPGRKGQFGLGPKNILATFGEVHPGVLRHMDLPGPIAIAEIVLDKIPAPRTKGGRTKPALGASTLMPVRRDFAFVVNEDANAEALMKAVRGADKAMIDDVRLFDVFRGEALGDGKKSLALEVTIQPRDKTLTDEEIEAIAGKIVTQAGKAVGATLRG